LYKVGRSYFSVNCLWSRRERRDKAQVIRTIFHLRSGETTESLTLAVSTRLSLQTRGWSADNYHYVSNFQVCNVNWRVLRSNLEVVKVNLRQQLTYEDLLLILGRPLLVIAASGEL
jgi:hypothetical protein